MSLFLKSLRLFKNPAYGRHCIPQPMRIEAPIPFFLRLKLFLLGPKKIVLGESVILFFWQSILFFLSRLKTKKNLKRVQKKILSGPNLF